MTYNHMICLLARHCGAAALAADSEGRSLGYRSPSHDITLPSSSQGPIQMSHPQGSVEHCGAFAGSQRRGPEASESLARKRAFRHQCEGYRVIILLSECNEGGKAGCKNKGGCDSRDHALSAQSQDRNACRRDQTVRGRAILKGSRSGSSSLQHTLIGTLWNWCNRTRTGILGLQTNATRLHFPTCPQDVGG